MITGDMPDHKCMTWALGHDSPRIRAFLPAVRGSAKVDERRWDAFNTVAAWISYPLPPVGGECLLAEAATTGRDQGHPRGRQLGPGVGNGDWWTIAPAPVYRHACSFIPEERNEFRTQGWRRLERRLADRPRKEK